MSTNTTKSGVRKRRRVKFITIAGGEAHRPRTGTTAAVRKCISESIRHNRTIFAEPVDAIRADFHNVERAVDVSVYCKSIEVGLSTARSK